MSEDLQKEFKEWLGKTEISEKINYSLHLFNSLRAVQLARLSDNRILFNQSISQLFSDIPRALYDDEFIEEMKKTRYRSKITRQFHSDPDKVYRAIINLLFRAGVLVTEIQKEAVI